MFCSYCGKRIPDDAKFCPYCGRSVPNVNTDENLKNARRLLVKVLIDYANLRNAEAATQSFVGKEKKNCEIKSKRNWTESAVENFDEKHYNDQPKMPCDPPQDKRILVSELERLYNYFEKKNNSYRHLVDSTKKFETQGKPSIVAWVIFGLLLSVIIYFVVYAFGLDVPVLLPFYWFFVTVFGYVTAKKKATKNRDFYRHMVISLNSELIEYYNKAIHCCIAYEYSDPRYLEQVLRILKTGRAERLPDAINIMLSDIQKGKILQQEQIRDKKQNGNTFMNALLLAMLLDKHKK